MYYQSSCYCGDWSLIPQVNQGTLVKRTYVRISQHPLSHPGKGAGVFMHQILSVSH